MTFNLLIVVGSLAVLFLAFLVLSSRSVITGGLASIIAIGMAAFCGIGFLASFELPVSERSPWHLTYGFVGLASYAIGIFGLRGIWSRKKFDEAQGFKPGE